MASRNGRRNGQQNECKAAQDERWRGRQDERGATQGKRGAKRGLCSAIALVVCVPAMGILAGCSHDGGDAFSLASYTSPQGTDVRGIAIQVIDREIEVVASADDQLHIDYFASAKESDDIAVSDEGILTMTSRSDKDWTDYLGTSGSVGADRITLQVPDIPLDSLELSTTNEDVSLRIPIVAERVSLTNNGGNISFADLGAASSIELESKNGNISGTIAGSYDDYAIACTIKKGDANLPATKSTGSKTLSAKNNNGDIDIAFQP